MATVGSDVQGHWMIDAAEVPMPLDTLITVGMLADVEGHGDRIPIKGIAITLQPRRDPAAEGFDLSRAGGSFVSAKAAQAIEAALLPYAVFDLGSGGWAYGRQIRRVYNEDGSDPDA